MEYHRVNTRRKCAEILMSCINVKNEMVGKQNVEFSIDEFIVFNGIEYPYKTITINDEYNPYYIIVSIEALEQELLDKDYIPVNDVAEELDNKIAYYVRDEDMLNLSDEILLKQIYI